MPASGRRSCCSAASSSCPLVIIVLYSFWEVVNYNVVHHWTTGNYSYFFSVSTYVSTMWSTLWVAVIATAIVIALAFPFAYWLSRYVPRRLRRAAPRPRRRPVLDELPAAGLLVADDPRREGRAEPVPAVVGPDEPPDRPLPLRPAGRDPRARLPLLPVRSAHVVRVDRALRLGSAPGRDGPRGEAA